MDFALSEEDSDTLIDLSIEVSIPPRGKRTRAERLANVIEMFERCRDALEESELAPILTDLIELLDEVCTDAADIKFPKK